MKQILPILGLLFFVACSSQTSIEKTTDSTQEVIDSQKYVTKDSVAHKSDTNKKLIDSMTQVLKDSMKQK